MVQFMSNIHLNGCSFCIQASQYSLWQIYSAKNYEFWSTTVTEKHALMEVFHMHVLTPIRIGWLILSHGTKCIIRSANWWVDVCREAPKMNTSITFEVNMNWKLSHVRQFPRCSLSCCSITAGLDISYVFPIPCCSFTCRTCILIMLVTSHGEDAVIYLQQRHNGFASPILEFVVQH